MRWVHGSVLAAVLAVLTIAGCGQNKQEPVNPAPVQEPQPVYTPPPAYPEHQIQPHQEPQPTPPTTYNQPSPQPPAQEPAYQPPVDTSATAAPPPDARPRQAPRESYAPKRTTKQTTHVIKKGDTLQKISQRYYGTTKRWQQIYRANRNVLKKGPNDLTIGTKIVIP